MMNRRYDDDNKSRGMVMTVTTNANGCRNGDDMKVYSNVVTLGSSEGNGYDFSNAVIMTKPIASNHGDSDDLQVELVIVYDDWLLGLGDWG